MRRVDDTVSSLPVSDFSLRIPGRIIFGRGAAQRLAQEVAGFGDRVLVVRGRSVAWVDHCVADLRALGCDVSEQVVRGEPSLPDIEAALEVARAGSPGVIVAIGGGAVIDFGKALAALLPARRPPLDHLEVVGQGLPLEHAPLPFIACPTTAGTGAEATKNAVIGLPEHGRKVSLRDDRMLADLALVDPALTDACPRDVTLASGLDAITQLIEPYLSGRANPLTDALCRDAIPRGLRALFRLMQSEEGWARDEMALASLTGGIALANSGLGAVHGFAGVIGGRFGTPHGAICGRLLAPVLRMNEGAVAGSAAASARFREIRGWIAAALDCEAQSAFDALEAWADMQGLPQLGDLLDPGADLTDLASEAQASSSMKANPVPLATHQLVQILWETLHR